MFDVWFEDQQKQKQFAWQTSWGYSTRSIGAMIMIHSDNKGLVLPPKVAHIQVVIIPIVYKDDDASKVTEVVEKVFADLKEIGVRTYLDDREGHNPGFKFNHWELRGVPIRIEVGMKDIAKLEVKIVRRDNGAKS